MQRTILITPEVKKEGRRIDTISNNKRQYQKIKVKEYQRNPSWKLNKVYDLQTGWLIFLIFFFVLFYLVLVICFLGLTYSYLFLWFFFWIFNTITPISHVLLCPSWFAVFLLCSWNHFQSEYFRLSQSRSNQSPSFLWLIVISDFWNTNIRSSVRHSIIASVLWTRLQVSFHVSKPFFLRR